jgi:hypothetical protein
MVFCYTWGHGFLLHMGENIILGKWFSVTHVFELYIIFIMEIISWQKDPKQWILSA